WSASRAIAPSAASAPAPTTRCRWRGASPWHSSCAILRRRSRKQRGRHSCLPSYNRAMPLPILQTHGDPTRGDRLRYYARGQLHWARHLGEEAQLDVGTAITNASLADVWSANQVRDVSLPEGTTPQQAVQEVAEHFAAAGAR